MLKHTHFKHHGHLRYLADNHVGHLIKVRFVLQPFSFVFLLEAAEQFSHRPGNTGYRRGQLCVALSKKGIRIAVKIKGSRQAS
jgi:hypothetical protein